MHRVTRPERIPTVLDAEQLAGFERDGFVVLRGAFERAAALRMQTEIWNEIGEEHGIHRADPTTWRPLPRSPRRAKTLPMNAELASERFQGAISDLLGHEDWERPGTWGGFLVNFPAPTDGAAWDVPTDTWHWDGPPDGDGLLIFSFYGTVAPGAGGTLILAGSHRLIADYYASLTPEERARPHKVHRKQFGTFDPWLAALTGRSAEPVADRAATFMRAESQVRGVPCRVVELTGEPGDVVYCNPGILHAAAPHHGTEPRVMRVKFFLMA